MPPIRSARRRLQILRHVILPNALPEIFTGLRTAMGVCWGTVVAAELVAADRGLGSMIMIAKNFLQTDTVVIGIMHHRPDRLWDRAAHALGRAAAGAVAGARLGGEPELLGDPDA